MLIKYKINFKLINYLFKMNTKVDINLKLNLQKYFNIHEGAA